MFDLENYCCYSYIATPIVEALQERGFFEILAEKRVRSIAELCERINANRGYLTICLEPLQSLGLLERHEDAYSLKTLPDSSCGLGLTSLYGKNLAALASDEMATALYESAIERLLPLTLEPYPRMCPMALGAFVVPLLARVTHFGSGATSVDIPPPLRESAMQLLSRRGILTPDGVPFSNASTEDGIRQGVFKTLVSYGPLLHRLKDLLFGDHRRVFQELHGGFQEPWLEMIAADLRREISDQMERHSAETVLDLECGDGLSARAVRDAMFDPGCAQVTFVKHGSSTRQSLFVRCLMNPPNAVDRDSIFDSVTSALAGDYPDVFLDCDGNVIPSISILNGWRGYLRKLSETIGNRPLIAFETHSSPETYPEPLTGKVINWTRRLARMHSITADAFVTLAAEVGLFSERVVKRYPATNEPCVATLQTFNRRNFIVRCAREEDIERLVALEELCWQHSRTSRERILRRLRDYPQGQFVLEKHGRVIGVIYSQRIEGATFLAGHSTQTVHELHRGAGSVIQLLALNVDPEAQSEAYGDQLLEFMLQRCSLLSGVQKVVAVTTCKRFDSGRGLPFDVYISQRGKEQDPVLMFHQAHGAEIVGVVPGYRPEDRTNLGNGVLIAYDIRNRTPQRQFVSMAEPDKRRSSPVRWLQASESLQQAAAEIMGRSPEDCDIDQPLMEMGLDSADLLKLQRLVENRYQLRCETGFFFEHNTIRRVANFLTEVWDKNHETGPVEVTGSSEKEHVSADKIASVTKGAAVSRSNDVAIVGMACKLPSGIETAAQLWQALAAQKCVVGKFPSGRRSWPSGSEMAGIDCGGFIDDVDAFDAAYIDVEQEMLFKLLLAANYLNVKSLIALCCAKFATWIKNKTPDQIKQHFGIRHDATAQEEQEIAREYKDLLG